MKLLQRIKNKPFAFITAGLLFCTSANSQLTTTRLEEKFVRYNESALQEKLYMHVDRNFYLAGDILWCKLYVVDATLHQPLDVSKVAYVEVLDEENKPALQSKIELDKGKGYGSLSMPVSIKSGNYKIRAYTSLMKNLGPDYFFEKNITIVNTQKSRELTGTVAKAAEPEILFFPEGGNLVSTISSKVACKVSGVDGKGIDFTATVVDESNKTIASFRSLKFGMGNFVFTPEPGHTYQAIIQTEKNKYTKNLPFVFEKGYVMQLAGGNTSPITITVQTNVADAGKLFLLAQTRQSLKTVLQADVQKGKAIFTIDPSKLGEGISQFTVLNGEGRPLCERLYFMYPTNNLAININGGQSSYSTRSKIDLAVKAEGKNDKTETDLSVAVYKVDELQGIDESNIQTFLWLSSDLKGYIESPGYYFGKEANGNSDAMDNLMLTQGWRRFNWDDVIRENTPVLKYPVEHSGHIITGKVTSSVTGKTLPNIETYLSVPGQNSNTKVAISDEQGNILLDFKPMRGSAEMIIQTDPFADSTARVELNSPFLDQYTTGKVPPFSLSISKEKLLSERSMGVRVQNVFSKTELKQFVNPFDTTASFQKPEGYYMIDDYTRFTTMEEILREYVGEMNVRDARSKYSVRLIENTSMPMTEMMHVDYFPTQPLILVDGVPLFNTDKLMKFEPLKMRKLEVYNKRYVMGRSSFAGILSWGTYKADLSDIELDPRALVIDYDALQLKREFYSPIYDESNTTASHTPDYRTLLYWSYDIPSDKQGEKHINFYTSDKKGKYIAVVEGLSAAGQCGSGSFSFEVR